MSKFGLSFSNLLSQIDTVNTKKDYGDEKKNYWKLTKDKEGNGSAIIRFLPNKDVDDFPFVRMYNHAFKDNGTGRWYIENSRSTLGGDETDYIGELNRELWNTGLEENKKIAGAQKRKLKYISNILIVKDPANPENNGKVFLFEYGKTIFDKIVAVAKPEPIENEDGESETADPINAFDPETGASFSLKQVIKEGWPNFDQSAFLKSKPLGDDDRVAEVMGQLYELKDEVAPEKFKSYDELKKKYLWATGQESKTGGKTKAKQSAEEDEMDSLAELASKPATKKAAPTVEKTAKKVAPPLPTDDDGDDDDAFFKSLLPD